MMGMERSQTRHVCGTYTLRLDNFGMDFEPSTTLYVNVRHHPFSDATDSTLATKADVLAVKSDVALLVVKIGKPSISPLPIDIDKIVSLNGHYDTKCRRGRVIRVKVVIR